VPSSAFSGAGVAVLVGVLLVAAWLIRRAGADLRAEVTKKNDAAGRMLTPAQVAAITSQGLATAEQLFTMSPQEQQLLAAAAVSMQSAQNQRRTREQ